MIKTAIIGDKKLFEMIEKSYDEIMSRNSALLTVLVAESVRFKGLIVSKDEREIGIRRILNFGHTFGHAVEMQMALKHGFAVATGMELATDFSFEKGYISLKERERIINLLKRFKLVTPSDLTDDQMEKLVIRDKKKTGRDIHFIFTKGIGDATIEKVPVSELLGFYKRIRNKK